MRFTFMGGVNSCSWLVCIVTALVCTGCGGHAADPGSSWIVTTMTTPRSFDATPAMDTEINRLTKKKKTETSLTARDFDAAFRLDSKDGRYYLTRAGVLVSEEDYKLIANATSSVNVQAINECADLYKKIDELNKILAGGK